MAVVEKTEDNRSTPRFDARVDLTCCPFTSRKVPPCAVHVLNCSAEGMCFRTRRALKPGQTICLYAPTTPDADAAAYRAGPFFKAFSLAEVRWCRSNPDDEEGCRVGVRYL